MSRLLGTQDYFNPKMTGTIGHETILVLPLHEEKSEETSKIPSADLGLSSMDTSEHVNDTQGSKPDLMEWSESPVDTMSTGSYPSGVGANTNLDSLLPDNAMAATAA